MPSVRGASTQSKCAKEIKRVLTSEFPEIPVRVVVSGDKHVIVCVNNAHSDMRHHIWDAISKYEMVRRTFKRERVRNPAVPYQVDHVHLVFSV